MPTNIKIGLSELSLANFAMVMATGIIAVACQNFGLHFLAHLLFVLNNILYVILCALTIGRLFKYPKRLWADLSNHATGLSALTFVAATNVLGTQYIVMYQNETMGLIFWCIGVIFWLLITYLVFTLFIIKEHKPTLPNGINGAWLLAVVATQSVAILSTLIATYSMPGIRLELNFIAFSMWLWGGMQYIWMMALIFYRYNFFQMDPSELTPPYWINMGAMAISTLGGSLLIEHASHAPYLHSVLPFIKGITIFYWATATWWIPMLVILGFWRHIYKRFPLRYDPLFWGAVFPLGMYTACTQHLNQVMQFNFLDGIAHTMLFIALIAWSLTFFGLCRKSLRYLLTIRSPHH